MNKLEELIASLNIHEQKAFVKHLQSPFFNGNSDLETLFGIMVKASKKKEVVPESLSNRMKWSVSELRYLQTDLTQHLEYFLAIRNLNTQPPKLELLKLEALSKRGCEKSWHYVMNEFDKNYVSGNADYHYSKFAAEENRVYHLSKKQTRKLNPAFDVVLYHLDAFYYSKKLQLFCEVINQKTLLTSDYELIHFNEIILQSEKYLHVPAVGIYYYLLKTLTDPENENHFLQAETVITIHEQDFPAKELNEIFFYIKNYCIRKINKGQTHYFKLLFEIYKKILGNKKLMKLDYLSQFEFKNIVSLSLRLNETDWCSGFIKKYVYHLHPDHRKNAYTYNMAYFHFMTGNFKQAIRMLHDVVFTDVVYQVDSRVVLLKCYFELDDMDAFFYQSSSFRLFLLRNRYISDAQKNINRNLIRYLTKIASNYNRPAKIRKLKTELENKKDVADLKWLMNKLDQY